MTAALLITDPTAIPKEAVVLLAGSTVDGQTFHCYGWMRGGQACVALTRDGEPLPIPPFTPQPVATTLDVVQRAFRDALQEAGVAIDEDA